MQTFDERRVATIMFVDMCGYTAFIGDEDPEEVARVLEQLKRIASEVVEACGGIINQFVGDEIVGLFGVRQSYEDDACRAVTAALELHARAREMGLVGTRRTFQCVLHSGIETGLVIARARDFRAGVYDVVGEPINLAARLRSLAGSDEILVGPRTLSQIAPFFVTEPLAPFVPRGTTREITPVRVLGASTAQRPFDTALRRGLTQYVGRELELTHIVEVAREVEEGSGRCLSVSGPPGMGKTRLFFEMQKRLESVLARIPFVLVGRCAAYGRAEPYQPFVDALRKLLEELADDPGQRASAAEGASNSLSVSALLRYGNTLRAQLPVFAYLLGVETDVHTMPAALAGERLRDAIVDALCLLLETLSETQLVVLMLEDWHTADEASDAALRQLVARLATRRVLFVLNFRSAELSPDAVPSSLHIELAPLDRTRTSEVAAAMLQTSRVPDDLTLYMHERTQGNPFFIEEVCRTLVETETVTRRGDAVLLTCPIEQLTTPSSVQAMVRARIDRLLPADKELLRLASVLGSEFSAELLGLLAEASTRLSPRAGSEPRVDLGAQLAELEAHGLLTVARAGERARFRFKHAITCEVAYADLPLDERQRHHDRIGHAIERRHEAALAPWYDVLAYHYAASPSTEKAVRFAELAGDRAMRAFSLEQAKNSFRVAINALDKSADGDRAKREKRVLLSLKWAACCVFNPEREQIAVLEVSLGWARALDDARIGVRCLCWMAWIAHVVGEQQRAVELYEQALLECDALHDDALVAQIRANIGLSYAMAARYDEALEALSASVSRRQLAELRSRSEEPSTAIVTRATTPNVGGGGYGYTLAYLGMIAGERGDFVEAYRLLEQALSIVEAAGRVALIGAVLCLRAMVESWQHDWTACARTAREVRNIAERVNGGYLRAMSLTLSGAARVFGAGEHDGIDSLRASVEWLTAHQILLSMSWNEGWLAEALLSLGRYDDAEHHAERALARRDQWDALGEAAAYRVLAAVYQERDHDLARARLTLEKARVCAQTKGSSRELALVDLQSGQTRARQQGC